MTELTIEQRISKLEENAERIDGYLLRESERQYSLHEKQMDTISRLTKAVRKLAERVCGNTS